MLRKKRDIVVGIAVPWSLYQHLQGAFAQAWARMCVDMDDGNRIFHPGDPFINVLRWLCRGIKDGETDGPAPAPVSGESFACGLLADFFVTVNGILEDQEPPAAPMTIEEMINRPAGRGPGSLPRPRWVAADLRDDPRGHSGEDRLHRRRQDRV